MKEYKCIMTRDTKYKVGYPTEMPQVAETIQDYGKDGWQLHTYHVVYKGIDMGDIPGFYHFLLFEKEKTA